jgi:outer membrane protein assembly factor BamD
METVTNMHAIMTNKMVKYFIVLIIFFIFANCSGNKPKDNLTFEERFKKGIEYLDKKKYQKAQDQFNQIVISGSHTELGDDALFYLAESYFLNKEYILATAEYERLVRRMKFSPLVEKARWRICQCFVEESPKFYLDQEYTLKALERLQEFIDEYPDSEFAVQAGQTILRLRNKMGKKAYEAGILYIKLGVYDSAIISFEDMLANYYDTDYAEEAMVGIIRGYTLMGEKDKAKKYFDENESKITTKELHDRALSYLDK